MQPPSILYEDTDCLVINKPPGLVVNRARSVIEETLQDWIEQTIHIEQEAIPTDFTARSGLVHRIDKETSGAVIIAKTSQAFACLQKQFKERVIDKTYLAIVHGNISEKGEIKAPIGRLPWNREHFGIVLGGKDAVTRYARISNFRFPNSNEVFSVVALYPQTGRTHQIRVHLKYINHPIVGDYLYAGRKTARDDRQWVTRVMLHAWKIHFRQPTSGKELRVEAPVPVDMERILPKVSGLY